MLQDGWYLCPTCGKGIQKVPGDAIAYNMPFYCRRCKVEWYPSICNGVEFGDDDPFPLIENDN